MKLRGKIVFSILSVVFVLFAIVIAYVGVSSSRKARRDAEALTLETVDRVAKELQIFMEEELTVVSVAASVIAQMDRSAPDARERVLEALKGFAVYSPRTENIWLVFEPNAFDGRDAEFAGREGHVPNGQFMVSIYDNKDGTARVSYELTPELVYDPSESAWYQTPLKSGEIVITEPGVYTYPDGRKQMVSSLCVPIRIDGKVVGVVGAELAFDEIQKMLAPLRVISERSSLLLIGNQGTVIFALRPEDIGKNVTDFLKGQNDADAVVQAIREGRGYTTFHKSVLSGQMAMKVYAPVPMGKSKYPFSFNVNVPVADMLLEPRAMTRNTIIAAVVGMALLAAVVLWIAGRIVKPILALSDLLIRASELNFQTDPTKEWLLQYKDEIGAMSRAYLRFQAVLTGVFHDLRDNAESFASTAENLAAISQESVAAMEEVKASVDEVVRLSETNSSALDSANESVKEVSLSASAMAQSAESGATAASNTANLTQEATGEVYHVVGKIRQIGEQSKSSSDSIQKVSASVDSITQFVSTIDGIATQTNLLALNAAIEAARAGEAGRGFAVVSEEVRKLAEESARAAQNVQALIKELQSDTKSAGDIVSRTAVDLEEIVAQANQARERLALSLKEVDNLSTNVQDIATASEVQASASSQTAQTVEQVAKATQQVVRNLNSIQSATEDNAKAGERLALEAQDLGDGVEKLRDVIGTFRHDDRETSQWALRMLQTGFNTPKSG